MNNMHNDEWIKLEKPPVILATFQIKFDQEESNITRFLEYDSQIRHTLPKRTDNIHANIDVPGTLVLGVSKITSTSNAKLTGYTYYTEDQKKKLVIEQDSLTFIDEHKYEGWDYFKESVRNFLKLYSPLLEKNTLRRISIRFINKFSFEEFNNPTDYFKTMVSTVLADGFVYPLTKYSFKLVFKIPDTDKFAIVNQDLENISVDKYDYIFDIDVLDKRNLIFDEQTVIDTMEELRIIKNNIFFDNITPKTIEKCN